ncbi:MAG: VOC family protein [Actinomycetota bacterium]
MAIPIQVAFDAADPDALSRFWAGVLGYIVQPPPEGFDSWDAFLKDIGVPESEWDKASAIVDPDGVAPRIYFQKVPEGKSAKNRVHLDVNCGGPRGTPLDERKRNVAEHVARAESLGARRLYERDQDGEYWITLADPEGNEFCMQ